jgi:hypothetical protein
VHFLSEVFLVLCWRGKVFAFHSLSRQKRRKVEEISFKETDIQMLCGVEGRGELRTLRVEDYCSAFRISASYLKLVRAYLAKII